MTIAFTRFRRQTIIFLAMISQDKREQLDTKIPVYRERQRTNQVNINTIAVSALRSFIIFVSLVKVLKYFIRYSMLN
jgi:hypothetical protein